MSPEGQSGKGVPSQPSTLLERFSDFLPHSGLALDVACGNGRNALFLARRGLSVVGIDRSWKAVAAGREDALRSNLKVSFVQADLTRFALPENSFSVVICFKYRDPRLYPSLQAALRPGGLLIYETYTREHAISGLKPQNPAHLLERSELLQAFGNWEIIFYREVWRERGTASLVARKPFFAREC
ncbi:MAG TPA: class I SAM-dependent methyltransferase [Terriglobia bacterium]|nr:class I SAM-dependent methyltransferase [Terriglobia bacterium]